MREREEENKLIDPEPFSTLLIALGAAGSIASLYAIVEQRASVYRAERAANRFAIRDALMGLETALNELRGYIRSLEIAFVTGSQSRDQTTPMTSLAQFGRTSLTFTRDGHDRWREIEEGITSTASRIQRHMSDLMRHFASTGLRLSPETAGRLQKTIERLNRLVGGLSQIHFQELFRSLEEVVGECMDVMRYIRTDLDELIRY
jgi:hypothetical protein